MYGCEICLCRNATSVSCPTLPECTKKCELGNQVDNEGCKTCECICPTVHCPDGPCLHGSNLDVNGCETCSCLRAPGSNCPPTKDCNKRCPYGFTTDSAGCPMCACKISSGNHECPALQCIRACLRGYVVDRFGCSKCECNAEEHKCADLQCGNSCPLERVKDEYGCETCNCTGVVEKICQKHTCPSVCKNGYQSDGNGCETCNCINECPMLKCNRTCTNGYAHDNNYCLTCECACTDYKCWDGPCLYGSIQDENGCETCECKRPEIPSDLCPSLHCDQGPCIHGSFLDRSGCETCRCRSPPEFICESIDTCKLDCDTGFEHNQYGCVICQCSDVLQPPVIDGIIVPPPVNKNSGFCPKYNCQYACQNDYELDSDGCPTCFCKGCKLDLNCWDGPCLHGSERDENGCETCECLRPKLPPVPCADLHCDSGPCPNGSFKDKHGCDSCICKELVEVACKSIEELDCDEHCEYGHMMDSLSCETCTCVPPAGFDNAPNSGDHITGNHNTTTLDEVKDKELEVSDSVIVNDTVHDQEIENASFSGKKVKPHKVAKNHNKRQKNPGKKKKSGSRNHKKQKDPKKLAKATNEAVHSKSIQVTEEESDQLTDASTFVEVNEVENDNATMKQIVTTTAFAVHSGKNDSENDELNYSGQIADVQLNETDIFAIKVDRINGGEPTNVEFFKEKIIHDSDTEISNESDAQNGTITRSSTDSNEPVLDSRGAKAKHDKKT
ncbi:uncharacterized protein LOC141908784 [Tubulanus polymorphus]|uniref:uncharacterized protein LOC141908784 n=1 Tax=Tubulanus polymorphus TaxID=672921 RepID=UPI003DA2AE36